MSEEETTKKEREEAALKRFQEMQSHFLVRCPVCHVLLPREDGMEHHGYRFNKAANTWEEIRHNPEPPEEPEEPEEEFKMPWDVNTDAEPETMEEEEEGE